MVREELAKKGKKGLQIRPMLEGEKGGCEEHWEGNGVREEVSYAKRIFQIFLFEEGPKMVALLRSTPVERPRPFSM